MQNRIMNQSLIFPGGAVLCGCDAHVGTPYTFMSAFYLTLNFSTVEHGQKVFDSLSDGGEIMMPFAPTFNAAKFGMVTDRYGVRWMINCNLAVNR